jgi:hypothetical protein
LNYLAKEYKIDESIAKTDGDEFVKDCISSKLLIKIDN